MEVELDWAAPVALTDGSAEGLIYTLDLDKLPSDAGIYIFARQWGKSFEALYIGRASNVRQRAKNHLNNLRLMRHIKGAKTGKRYFVYATPQTSRGKRLTRLLEVAELGLIRHFLAEAHDLANKQGTRITRHEIRSDGRLPKSFVPSLMYLEARRSPKPARTKR